MNTRDIDPDCLDFEAGPVVQGSSAENQQVYYRTLNDGKLVEVGVLYFDGSFDCWLNPAPWSVLSELRSYASKFRIHCNNPLA